MAELLDNLGPAGLGVAVLLGVVALGVLTALTRASAWVASVEQTYRESLAVSITWACATGATAFLVVAWRPLDGAAMALVTSAVALVGLERALLGVPVRRGLVVAALFMPMLGLVLAALGAVGAGIAGPLIRP